MAHTWWLGASLEFKSEWKEPKSFRIQSCLLFFKNMYLSGFRLSQVFVAALGLSLAAVGGSGSPAVAPGVSSPCAHQL